MKQEILPNAVYNTAEAAELLGLTPQTINKYVKKGYIRVTIIGGKWYRFTGQAILDFLNESQELQLLPCSFHYEDGWMPRINIIRHASDRVLIRTWEWRNNRLESKEAADYVAKFAAKQRLMDDPHFREEKEISIDEMRAKLVEEKDEFNE